MNSQGKEKLIIMLNESIGRENIGSIEKNIKLCKKFSDDPEIPYNIGTAYMEIYRIYRKKLKEKIQNEGSTPKKEKLENKYKMLFLGNPYIQNAKKYFREAILKEKELSYNIRKYLWINYGNCLDSVRRTAESFFMYDKAMRIDPEYPMAIGNKAIAMNFFADISGKYKEEIKCVAYRMLEKAIDKVKKEYPEDSHAIDYFKNTMESIQVDKTNKAIYPKYNLEGKNKFEEFFIDFCINHNLFLNFCIHAPKSIASIEDPIFISSEIDPEKVDRFHELAKYVNQIKEDYMIARLLLVQSVFRNEEFERISSMTTLVNTLDYTSFDVYFGLLKSAFKQTYNILDKIAVFINEYYSIGLEEKDIQFFSREQKRCIWLEKNKIRKEILQAENRGLYALYDIFLDLGYYVKFQEIRNALVHRKLLVYDPILSNKKEEDEYISDKNLLMYTVELLQLVKSAIVYMINFANIEEKKKVNIKITLLLDIEQNFYLPILYKDLQ